VQEQILYAFNSILKFFQLKREQIDLKEIAIGTVRNFVVSANTSLKGSLPSNDHSGDGL
jgi:hypothetical protein